MSGYTIEELLDYVGHTCPGHDHPRPDGDVEWTKCGTAYLRRCGIQAITATVTGYYQADREVVAWERTVCYGADHVLDGAIRQIHPDFPPLLILRPYDYLKVTERAGMANHTVLRHGNAVILDHTGPSSWHPTGGFVSYTPTDR